MPERKKSILNILGWGLLGDVFLFTVALAVLAIFSISSFSAAYMIAFVVRMLVLAVTFVFKRNKRKTDSSAS
jgi:hypothetical protein